MENSKFYEWLDKLERFCAYRERCQSEIETKMRALKIPIKSHEKLIESLIENKFLNEERYVRYFIRGKVKVKKDGLQKIQFALRQKKIPDNLILKGFQELDAVIYKDNIKELILKKWNSLKDQNNLQDAKTKLIRYLMGKGYRYDEFKTYLTNLD